MTRPERYAALPGFARRLIDNLLVEYDAEISHDEASASSDAVGEVGDATRVCPRLGAGGCLAVRETSFPGVVLEVGRWHSFRFPRCGCDACDEQVSDLTDHMADIVAAFVNGRFMEYLADGRLGHSWSNGGRSTNGWCVLDDADPRRDQSETIQWSAWPRRLSQP